MDVPPFRAAQIVGARFAFLISLAHVKDRLKATVCSRAVLETAALVSEKEENADNAAASVAMQAKS
jgi:hypothetical protein